MSFLETLQQKIGFTRKEAIAILVLSGTFLTGLGIRWFQSTQNNDIQTHQQFDYSKSDSTYAARAQAWADGQRPPTQPLPSSSTPSQTSPRKVLSSQHRIDLNTATKTELMTLPGIGSSFADRILEYRTTHGKFTSVEDLSGVKGIGEKKLQKLRPLVRIQQ